MKSILIAFALIGTIGTAPARAATCQDLRTKLNRLEWGASRLAETSGCGN